MVKLLATSYKKTHETQLQALPEGEHGALMQRVWKNLLRDSRDVNAFAGVRNTVVRVKLKDPITRPIRPKPIKYKTVDPNLQLLTPDLERLVTPFT